MSDLIRQALGWTNGPWPPDFYALLGLTPGPTDPDHVEAAVLERMEKLRVFQLVHPESVTEAMNLLARALITLSDQAAKSDYDQALPAGPHSVQHGPATERTTKESTVVPLEPKPTQVANAPPPLSAIPLLEEAEPVTRPPTALERSLASEWPTPPVRRPVRPARRRQRSADQTIVCWVVQLRQLLQAWDEAGNWLAIPELTFATRIEAVQLILALRQIGRRGPTLFDQTGPGSTVLNLAQSRPTSTMLMEVSPTNRDQLARDWRKGRRIILEEYHRTRQRMSRQSRRFRIRPPWQSTLATWALMTFAIGTLLIVIVRSWRGV